MDVYINDLLKELEKKKELEEKDKPKYNTIEKPRKKKKDKNDKIKYLK